jgi:hypothetical protein
VVGEASWQFSQRATVPVPMVPVVGEANCPSLPSGRTDDLTRWILRMQAGCWKQDAGVIQPSSNLNLNNYTYSNYTVKLPMQESLTNQKAEKGRSGGQPPDIKRSEEFLRHSIIQWYSMIIQQVMALDTLFPRPSRKKPRTAGLWLTRVD